ncbi:MAG: hypothetical protein KJ070_16140 [Verrucomicrobia bacterium]|nr:hypothetical protein [Verrucomicrobiota bacterium]
MNSLISSAPQTWGAALKTNHSKTSAPLIEASGQGFERLLKPSAIIASS